MLVDDFFLGTKLYRENFSDFCRPLETSLGVTKAIYINVDKHGKMFSICTDTKWVETFLDKTYYKLDPLMVCPQNMSNGFSFDESSDEEDFKDLVLFDAQINFDWYHSFAYIEKTTDGGYFGFDFGTNKENQKFITNLINEAQVIKKAIRKLNSNIISSVKNLDEKRMDFSSLKGERYYKQKGLVFNEKQELRKKSSLLKSIGFIENERDLGFLTEISLSPQEINCLREYLMTRSVKKISEKMGLTLSTVAGYVEQIKNKLACNSKNDLFKKGEILESLGRI